MYISGYNKGGHKSGQLMAFCFYIRARSFFLNMKNLFVYVLATMVLVACEENPSGTNSSSPGSGDTTKTQGFNPTQHEKEILQNPVVATENNTESAYKLVTTMPDYSMWGVLVGHSKYAKQLHHENWVILAPSNMVLQNYDMNLLSLLKDSTNQKMLDELIASHIIKSPFSCKKMIDIKEVETIDGQKFPCLNEDQTINGVKVSGVEFYTKMGTVVSMEGVINFPDKALTKKFESKKKK
jgi:uncharacterized surface protein with fasciclin (FAS1) repeats